MPPPGHAGSLLIYHDEVKTAIKLQLIRTEATPPKCLSARGVAAALLNGFIEMLLSISSESLIAEGRVVAWRFRSA